MIKKIAIALVSLVLLIAAGGAALPRTWRVEQSIVIASTPQRVHPFVNDLKRWQEWSVWTHAMDPQVRNMFEGPQDGVGARWTWMGPKMGQGRIEIVSSDPATGITLDEAIEMEKVNAHASIRFTREGDQTRVTWTDEGTLPPVLGGFFRRTVEELLATNFAAGLLKLKSLVEALPQPVPVPVVPVVIAPDVDSGVDAGSL